jgi:uncharacterized protein with GYD domain
MGVISSVHKPARSAYFGRDVMPIYISRGRFTSDAIKGMLAKPEDREEAVAKLFKSVGGKLIGWYLTFGHHDWMSIGEFPDEEAAASAILAAAAGGSLSDIETTVAMTAKRCGSHLRICWKGGEEFPERRPLVGSSEIFSLNAMSASILDAERFASPSVLAGVNAVAQSDRCKISTGRIGLRLSSLRNRRAAAGNGLGAPALQLDALRARRKAARDP